MDGYASAGRVHIESQVPVSFQRLRRIDDIGDVYRCCGQVSVAWLKPVRASNESISTGNVSGL